jgi:hypothetical protein
MSILYILKIGLSQVQTIALGIVVESPQPLNALCLGHGEDLQRIARAAGNAQNTTYNKLFYL